MKPRSRQETPRRKLKPFLIFPLIDNKENLDSAMPKNPGLKLFTKIRPPKIESAKEKEQRPLTATLEKPKILNVKLITKIDMSKIRKEFLNITNLCRIPLAVKVRKKKQIVHRPLSICAVDVSSLRVRKMESSDESWEDEESSRNSRLEKIPKTKLKPCIAKTSLRAIPRKSAVLSDKNNNKSVEVDKKGPPHPSANINRHPPIRKEIVLSTKVPEPCKTCGRSNQPERFHSHPETPLKPLKKVEVSISVPVRNSVQKPVAIKYKSKKLTIQKSLPERKPSLPSQVLEHSPPATGQTTVMNASSKPVSRASSAKRTLTCYICGREFGTASLPLHEPKCLEKWERENKNLPVHLRRSAPIKPDPNCPVEEWNRKALETFESKLLPCLRCGRTFNPESLIVHQRSCRESQYAIVKPIIDIHKTSVLNVNTLEETATPKSPLNMECTSCGKKFGSHSIKIHQRQCLQKNQFQTNTSSHIPKDTRDSNNLKSHTLIPLNRPSSGSRPTSERSKPQIFPCYLCGKMFSIASIHIHEPQCLKKWRIENEKLPPHRQRREPSKPDVKYTSEGKIDIEATTEDCWQTHLSQLVACKYCARTFNPDRVSVHERNCKG
ncbi:hypothetical protein WA026_007907 [Henosepilachna vigintioctopunctata]|uniref:C2HC/C3H-type domain-containing protein n=1 Tax=Henosepilachna vigintioctopunctata TaxID=420089 RepID=A0AAW1TVC4_9CUCU